MLENYLKTQNETNATHVTMSIYNKMINRKSPVLSSLYKM